MEGFETQSRPRPERDGTAERSVDRLLDSVVEQVIAESAHRRPSPPGACDPVDVFLSDAAAFLRGRADQPELIGRLRELAAEAAPAAETVPAEPEPPEAPQC